jgi:ATP-dependent RNA helicase DDX51/DBP6
LSKAFLLQLIYQAREVSDGYVYHCRLAEALQRMGIESFFPVQEAAWVETIGPGAFERDVCINSPTGSGKTLAYALPIVQMLSTRKVRCLRALVVLPTRDLALQVGAFFCLPF